MRDDFCKLLAEHGELGLCLLNGYAGFEPADAKNRVAPACGFLSERKRSDDVHLVAGREDRVEVEAAREHADDGGRHVIEREHAADDGRIAGEATLPETVAEDDSAGFRHDAFGAEPSAFIGGEVAPVQERDAEGGKKIIGDSEIAEAFGLASAGEGEAAVVREGKVGVERGGK